MKIPETIKILYMVKEYNKRNDCSETICDI